MSDVPSDYPWEATFVENMTRRRKALGLSQSGLAKALAARGLPFHQPTVQRIETGERPVRLNEAVHIVQVLQMGAPGLLGLDHAVYPADNAALGRVFLIEDLKRVRAVVTEAEQAVVDATDRAFSAVEIMAHTLRGYEQALGHSLERPDQVLIDACHLEIARFNDNAYLHPDALQRREVADGEHREEA